MRDAMLFLQKYGISIRWQERFIKLMGCVSIALCRKNPYLLAEDIVGVGFKTADEIAGRIGIHTDSDYRIRSGILYTFYYRHRERGICICRNPVCFSRHQKCWASGEEQIEPQLANLMMDKKWWSKRKTAGRSCMPCRIITQS